MAYGNGGEAGAPRQNYNNAAPSSAPPDRMPMVALELDRQAKTVEHLHSLISDLELRLSAIVRPDAPTPIAVTEKAMQTLVPLAGGLSEQNHRITSANARLQSLLERIEL